MTVYDSTKDRFSSVATDPIYQARQAFVVTPSDTLDLTDPAGDNMPAYAKSLYVGVTGDITVIMAGDIAGASPVLLQNVYGMIQIQVRRIKFTGTSAANIVAMF